MRFLVLTVFLHTSFLFAFSQIVPGENNPTLFHLIESCRKAYKCNIVYNPRDIQDRVLENTFNPSKGKKAFVSYLQSIGYNLIVDKDYIIIKSYSGHNTIEPKKEISASNLIPQETHIKKTPDKIFSGDSIIRETVPVKIKSIDSRSLKIDTSVNVKPILPGNMVKIYSETPVPKKDVNRSPVSLYTGISADFSMLPEKDIIRGIASETPTRSSASLYSDLEWKHLNLGLGISGYIIKAGARDSVYTYSDTTFGNVTRYIQYRHSSQAVYFSLKCGYRGKLAGKFSWETSTGLGFRLWEQKKNTYENRVIRDSLISDDTYINKQAGTLGSSFRFIKEEYPDMQFLILNSLYYDITPMISLSLRIQYLSPVRHLFSDIGTDNFSLGMGITYALIRRR